MNKIDFSSLDFEFIRNEPIWGSFLEALQEFYTEQVREPLSQLQEIRDLKATTPLVFVKQALNDLGITIPPDMIVDPERLYNSVYMLPLMHQQLGRESAYRMIAYILGRRVTAYPLYTEDYATFYEQPLGALRIDGGTWYKTTHINLEMQKVPADQNIKLPVGTTLKDRFLSAFFSLAPINLVIDQFFFSIEVENTEDLGITGVVYRQPVRRLICDADYSLDNAVFTLDGPDEVYTGFSASYVLRAKGQVFESDEWTSTHKGNVSISQGFATFSGFEQDTLVTISATIRGQTVTKDISVRLGMQDIRRLEIIGPDEVASDQTGDYTVIAYHSEGSDQINVDLSVLSPYAYFAGGTLHTRNMLEDQTVTIHCKTTINTIPYTAAKKVKLKYIDPNVHLVGLTVSGSDRMKEGSQHQLYSTAHFSDGSTMDVLSRWASSSPAVVVENGLASTMLVAGETNVEITAEFGFRNLVMRADHEAVVYPEFVSVAQLNILGPSRVTENTKASYTCMAVMTDGSSTLVTPEWFTNQFYITDTGNLHAGLINQPEIEAEVRASYGGIYAALPITIARPVTMLESLIILGSDSIKEGDVNRYIAYAQYTDGRVLKIEPEWTVTPETDWATIINGELIIDKPEDGLISIQITYEEAGQTYTQNKTIVCVSATNSLTGLIITGPNTVNALDRVVLTATAVYEDGSFASVNPKWEVYTLDANAEFIAADVAGYGVVTGRNVDFDMDVIVRATYFREVAEYPMTVKYIPTLGPDVPVSSRIIGNSVIYSTQVASFSQAILFENCPNELLVSSDWAVDNPNINVDENGFVTCKLNVDMTFTITATWNCGGRIVIDSMAVTVVPIDAAYTGIGIRGPDTIQIGVKERYAAEAYTPDTGNEEGKGLPITPNWEILSDSLNLVMFADGTLLAQNSVVNQVITLAANFTYENTLVEATKTIRVLGSGPVYCVGQPAVVSDYETLFPLSLMISEEAFRDDMQEYGYMMVPAVFGYVTFYDATTTQISPDWAGPDGSNTPAVHKHMQNGVETTWYVYRTISANLGQRSYRIAFNV